MGLLQRALRVRAMPLGFEVRNGRETLQVRAVCNLYSITTNQEAIIRLFRVMNRYVGNLPPMTGVFPDYPAPVVRKGRARQKRLGHSKVGITLDLYSHVMPGMQEDAAARADAALQAAIKKRRMVAKR